MAFRPQELEINGLRILRFEYMDLTHRELLEAFDQSGEIIRQLPARSARILTVLNSRFNEQSAEAFKRYALHNTPFVAASAIVATPFWSVVVTSLKLNGRRDIRLFANAEDALGWLTRPAVRPRVRRRTVLFGGKSD